MYLNRSVSARRLHEAENARRNRLEIVKALSHGQITRRDLFRMGIFTTTGLLACKNGLSPFAPSAFAAVPTGTPLSPLFGVKKFTQRMPRAEIASPLPMVPLANGDYAFGTTNELPAREFSYHEEFTKTAGGSFVNPVTGRGPIEGRPPGAFFAHQRWADIPPKVGYLMSMAQARSNVRFHRDMPAQDRNAVWAFAQRAPGAVGRIQGSRFASGIPQLIRFRYGESVVCRIYNDLPDDVTDNYGFGRNEISTHYHNAHNGSESDGACNAYHFPGTFYDYHWSSAVARRDMPEIRATSVVRWQDRCSTVLDNGGFERVEGDFRELQGTMWFHDHRFFFTAENVHKGSFSLAQMYSGPDRGNEAVNDGINLRLPSGKQRNWGNVDFDVYLAISNPAFDRDGQLFFDIFDTDGFLGDMLCVNGAYCPFMEVLPRRYRFRLLNASMARFIRLVLSVERSAKFATGSKVPIWVIANDGNLLPRPVRLTDIDTQGVAERFDIVVDFSRFNVGDRVQLVNVMQYSSDGRKPDGAVSLSQALQGVAVDPAVGPFLQFRVVGSLESVDGLKTYTHGIDRDESVDFTAPEWNAGGSAFLTSQIPVATPVRTRTIEFKRDSDSSRDPVTGLCTPDCGDIESFPWGISVEGQATHSLNANRISELIPRPGDIEHWVLINGGGGWDHPIHLHFEEAVTIDRAGDPVPATERLARKDVWRLGSSGKRTVRIQVRFGEFGGAYVAHCHNTTHEDFAMLMRYQLLTPDPQSPNFRGQAQWVPTDTPIPSRDGVTWKSPEILPEGDPRRTI